MQILTKPVVCENSLPLDIVHVQNITDDEYISNVELHLWSMYIHACM